MIIEQIFYWRHRPALAMRFSASVLMNCEQIDG